MLSFVIFIESQRTRNSHGYVSLLEYSTPLCYHGKKSISRKSENKIREVNLMRAKMVHFNILFHVQQGGQ